MAHDESAARRLVDYCARLPDMPGAPDEAKREHEWVKQQLVRHRQTLLEQMGLDQDGRGGSALRCEADATDAAVTALEKLWERRFGASASVT